MGFRQSKADYSIFFWDNGNVYIVILIYVDDVIVVGSNLEQIQQTKRRLDEAFGIKDLGQFKYFLGIEVAKIQEGLILSQRRYMLDILRDNRMLGCKPSSFPIEQNLKLY